MACAHLRADLKHGHDVWVAQSVVQQGLQVAARVEVPSHLLQHLDGNKRPVPITCGRQNMQQQQQRTLVLACNRGSHQGSCMGLQAIAQARTAVTFKELLGDVSHDGEQVWLRKAERGGSWATANCRQLCQLAS